MLKCFWLVSSSFFLFFLLAMTSAFSYDFSAVYLGQSIYYNITSDTVPYTVEVTSQNKKVPFYTTYPEGSLDIPSTVTYNSITYSVTRIGDYAFHECSLLNRVGIPQTVTSIGYAAFAGCSGLSMIVIPDAVSLLEDFAFARCSGLTSIRISESVKYIGTSAFVDCSKLTTAHIPANVESVGTNIFLCCTNLESITVDSNNKYFRASEGILYSYHMDSLYICPCAKTGTIAIPNSVKSILFNAFAYCSGLTSILFGNSVSYIDHFAFSYCSGLKGELKLPESLLRIGVNAFVECKGLTGTLVIPDSVITIYDCAFAYCEGFDGLVLGKSVDSIGNIAFSGCQFEGTLFIPDSVRFIGVLAFGHTLFSSVIIGKSVNFIGSLAIWDCSKLNEIIVKAEIPPIFEQIYMMDNTIPIYIPCGALSVYQNHANWSYFLNMKEAFVKYNVNVKPNNKRWGSTKTTVPNCEFHSCVLNATANPLCRFVRWSDGITDNPRTLTVTQDTLIEAEFKMEDGYCEILVVSNNKTLGWIEGGGIYPKDTVISLKAMANDYTYLCKFDKWSDGVTDNPRIVKVTQDSVFVAEFVSTTHVLERDEASVLNIYPNPTASTLTIDNGEGMMKEVRMYDVRGRKVKRITVNHSQTTIDVGDLQNGMYFLKISTEKGVLTRKVQIIQ